MDSLPRVVDRYELLSVLGSGGFATVYRGRHVHTQQPVAVKILENRSGADRWLTEARAAAAVQHRNVVRVLDCGRSGDDVFIVMDLVEGPTLADVLHGGALPPQRAVGIAVQLLDGLAAAHARSIVHRDIKPPNILLTQDTDGSDLPKILDFGVSKQLTEISGTLDGTAIGTPGYMAPELFGGARHADSRVDIYAVAATLYEMLSGKLPFMGRSYEELVVQVATTRPVPLSTAAPHVPPEIAAAVDRGLARDREARWQTAEQFASALRGALMGIAPPSSHAFEATLYATSPPPSPPLIPSPPLVPSIAMPEPSTLRTAPPPVVSTASRNEARSSHTLPWVLGILSFTVLGAAALGIVAWRFMRADAVATAPSVTAPVTLPAPSASPPAPSATATQTQGALDPTPSASVTATASATHTTTPSSPNGIIIHFPQATGFVNADAVDTFAQSLIPKFQRCRPAHGSPPVLARVQLMPHEDGTIAIAQPNAPDPGDVEAARCMAAVFKSNANSKTFHPGGVGNVVVEARLDPR